MASIVMIMLISYAKRLRTSGLGDAQVHVQDLVLEEMLTVGMYRKERTYVDETGDMVFFLTSNIVSVSGILFDEERTQQMDSLQLPCFWRSNVLTFKDDL